MIYIKNLALKNFKCFEDLPSMEFGKITLVTGANSTGKSSLLYSILGIMQSEKFPLNYHLNGNYVEMGSYSEIVYNGDVDKEIVIDFTLVNDEIDISYSFHSVWKREDYKDQPSLNILYCKSDYFDFELHNNGESAVYHLDYYPHKNIQMQQNALLDIFQQMAIGQSINGEQVSDYNKQLASEYVKFVTQETHLQNIVMNSGETNAGEKAQKLKDVLPITMVLNEIEEIFRLYNSKLNYLSSYRIPAKRIYTDRPVASGKINNYGEGFVNELLDWHEKDKSRFDELVAILRKLGLLYDISPKRTEKGGFRVGIKIHKNSAKVALSDVGFGVSQILPVVVGDIELGNKSSLFTSQPEIHLHPSVQADLGDYFVEQANRGKRYLIETHSEYLINRIRLNIVKGILKEEDIKVYYLSQKGCHTLAHEITFAKNGQILGAPEDFFDTYMMDTMNIAMEAE